MKKVFLLTITAGLAISSFAQNARTNGPSLNATEHYGTEAFNFSLFGGNEAVNKTTADIIHDSIILFHSSKPTDTTFYYTLPGFDTAGYVFGTNRLGINGFAERYDFKSPDSSIQVLGIVAIFKGTVNPATTKNVTFTVWSQGAIEAGSTNVRYSGFPNTVVSTKDVSYKNLGIGGSAAQDTFKSFWFATPTAYLTDSFFVGFTLNYTWASMGGDTITTYYSKKRLTPVSANSPTDTMVNSQSALRLGGTWYDLAWDQGLVGSYFIWPVVNSKIPVGVGGITKKNFTFMGNYPNPAVNSTNIKFSLANATDVTIQVMDINGRVINTINQTNMAAGEHVYQLETSSLPAGEYVYIIRTTEGGGIASKITIIK